MNAAPDTPAGRRLAELLAGDVTPGGATPADGIAGLAFERVESSPAPHTIVAIARDAHGRAVRVAVRVSERAPHVLEDSARRRAPELDAEPAAHDWHGVEGLVRACAARVGFLACELHAGGRVDAVHAVSPDEPLATGSAFKLWVLGELARQVRDARASWDEPLVVRADHQSLFSGPMVRARPGTVYTLHRAAAEMISVSGNPATDHLLFRLGRRNVEDCVSAMGVADPSRNVPGLATREIFQLKMGPTDRAERYAASGADERRRILDGELRAGDLPDPAGAEAWTAPRFIDSIEWFASASDFARTMATLRDWSREPGLEPVAGILSISPGLRLQEHGFTWVGYKGGSEPGVLNRTWLLERDDRWFVLTSGFNDTERLVGTDDADAALDAAARLLARV